MVAPRVAYRGAPHSQGPMEIFSGGVSMTRVARAHQPPTSMQIRPPPSRMAMVGSAAMSHAVIAGRVASGWWVGSSRDSSRMAAVSMAHSSSSSREACWLKGSGVSKLLAWGPDVLRDLRVSSTSSSPARVSMDARWPCRVSMQSVHTKVSATGRVLQQVHRVVMDVPLSLNTRYSWRLFGSICDGVILSILVFF
nr:MAG TPA: hypothetical protein [Caudoviricetes sp.]